MQQAVGGYIEPILVGSKGATMMCNEDGRSLRLAPNNRASLLAKTFIVGDVLITGPATEDSNSTPFTLDDLDRIENGLA
jgi:hypothetical protein